MTKHQPRRVFLSYPWRHERHEAIKSVCDFLAHKGCLIDIPPNPTGGDYSYYPAMETVIEQCDVFIAVPDPIVTGSSMLAHHLNYAASLHRMRWEQRPRIFGLWLESPKKGAFSAAWPIELLDRSNLSVLLEDLPYVGGYGPTSEFLSEDVRKQWAEHFEARARFANLE
jgi:hypothetical protein